MATPKTADKKPSTKKATTAAPTVQAAPPQAGDPQDVLATDVLVTLLHRALVRLGEPARASEIARELEEEAVSPALVRHVLETHPRRFVAVDRRWDINQRYLDKLRPTERTLEELVALYGAPMPIEEVAGELSQIYGRVREHFTTLAPRLLRGAHFFPTAGGQAYGLRAWLLNVDSETQDDLLFYNYLSEDALAPYQAAAKGLDWDSDPIGAARALLAVGNGLPVDNRILQYFAYSAQDEDFDGVALYAALAADDGFLALPDHRWMLTSSLDALRARWQTQAQQAADLATDEPVAEAALDAPAPPLDITPDDLEEIRRTFQGREDALQAADILTGVLEVRAGSRSFAADLQTLTDFLRARPKEFVWVGGTRFRAPGTLPPYIGQVPDSLTFPVLPRFETADGEILDQMLADAAYEEALQEEIADPVAQDVNDQEPADKTRWPEGVSADAPSLRLVLKAHHKEIGTFPLAQVPPGFLPTGPSIVELTLRDAENNAYPVYADYDVQLMYGLFDVYEGIAADSGAVFHLEKTERPDEFRFVSQNETDAAVFVSPGRMEELADSRTEVEGGSPISTYDLLRAILDHHGKKGCSFLTLLTELNLVRRTPRRLVASILSSYSAFHLRSNRWTFDAKKEPEGFDKRKTGYILRR